MGGEGGGGGGGGEREEREGRGSLMLRILQNRYLFLTTKLSSNLSASKNVDFLDCVSVNQKPPIWMTYSVLVPRLLCI